MRILDSAEVEYTTTSYNCDERALDAVTVAREINAEPEKVFKTLVARNDKNEVLVFVIPGNFELDLKKAARAAASKSIAMLAVKELQPVTGYMRGGCSPLGMKKHFPTFIDETALLHERIYVSAGVRGTQICLSPVKLAEVTGAVFKDLV